MCPFVCRLYKHVQLDGEAVCQSNELFQHYLKDSTLHEQSPDTVSDSLFKILVHKIYNINTSHTTSGSKLIYVYRGISYVPTPTPAFPIMDNQDLPDNWFIMSNTNETIRIGQETNIILNGITIFTVVEIGPNREVCIKVGSHVVQPVQIGLTDTFWTTFSVYDYLKVIGEAQICLGKEVSGYTKGCVTCEVQGVETNRKNSKSCSGLLNILSRGKLCRNCQYLKVTKQPENSKWATHVEEECPSAPSRLPDERMEEYMEALFPNGNETLMEFIRAQSLICQVCWLSTLGRHSTDTFKWASG